MLDFADIIGMAGVSCILGSYFLLQASVLQVRDLSYSIINAIGAILILYSLSFHWNTSSVVIEIFWFSISLYGIIAHRIRKKKGVKSSKKE
jgi:asparagine N-glycosylation enzyme membrane subunit Stt3